MKKYCLSKIGEKYGDLLIIDGGDKKRTVVVECTICRRVFKKNYQHLKNLKAASHESCSKFIVDWDTIKNSGFYSSWANMKTRVNNTKSEKYKNYGGRDINCEEFNFFVDFYDLMYESYIKHVEINGSQNTTIERIDVNDNYCIHNCTWATKLDQAKNKTNTRMLKAISPEGEEYLINHLPSFCEEYDISYGNVIAGFSRKKGTKKVKLRTKWTFEMV